MEEIKGLIVLGTQDLVDQELLQMDEVTEKENERDLDAFSSSLAAHIRTVFDTNKDAKKASGIEEELFSCLRAYNGEYDPSDLMKIREEGGSEIYMNLTATKCRTAISWIGDLLLSKEKPFSLEPTPLPNLPQDIQDTITTSIQNEWKSMLEATHKEGGVNTKTAQKKIKELNQNRRDIEEAVMEEIMAEAKYQAKKMETEVYDQLLEGRWDSALTDFIEDFSVFPTAFMKGPIITKNSKLTWVNGSAQTSSEFSFLNKRVSPFDIYPSPSASRIEEGNLVEHVRYTRKEINDLKGVEGYDSEKIEAVLALDQSFDTLFTGIESEKAQLEMKGTQSDANKGMVHGLHYFGSASAKLLKEWGLTDLEYDDTVELDIEAVLIGNEVIKASINDDPLSRRPYYAASFQNRPGSIWGRSLPNLMRDIARMCNATARALANNMGMASGPQVEVYVDRLADKGAIEGMRPWHIWQLTSDPTGAGGRAINFFQPSSNAAELLAVYKEFEQRADDATGVPRYAYGNEKVGGAAATVGGLSMLIDSSTKSIKDAIRHIDTGLIKPRVEFQFYYNIRSKESSTFTGDICVIPRGTMAITIRGAEQLRRNEFLQLTSNPTDMQILGLEGRSTILREVAKDIGFINNPIPSRLELKDREEKAAADAASKPSKESASIEATKVQVDGQKEMAAGAQAVQREALAIKREKQDADVALKVQDIELKKESIAAKTAALLEATKMTGTQRDIANKRNAAVALKGQEIKTNVTK